MSQPPIVIMGNSGSGFSKGCFGAFGVIFALCVVFIGLPIGCMMIGIGSLTTVGTMATAKVKADIERQKTIIKSEGVLTDEKEIEQEAIRRLNEPKETN
jgi:hypothetical protein